MWNDLLGKKIIAFRGHRTQKYGIEVVILVYILFDDQETWLELAEQSPFDYHDCCSSARMINLHKDAKQWQQLFDQEGCEACSPIWDPFI